MFNNNSKINNHQGQMGIRSAAEFLRLSIDTLRRLDARGSLLAKRSRAGAHRYYNRADLEDYLLKNIIAYTNRWLRTKKPYPPNKIFYCSDSFIFSARLNRLLNDLENLGDTSLNYNLLLAAIGEIGDNTFAHNLGNFPDIKGLLFAYNLEDRIIVLADRGRGILDTLAKVLPNLRNDAESLRIAFTEVISGRAPENRGNGLKFVREQLEKFSWSLFFQSGTAGLTIVREAHNFVIKKAPFSFRGCLAIINF